MANITTVGIGCVGLVAGACLADLGNQVVCINRSQSKSENLRQGILPICEPNLEEIVQRYSEAGRLHSIASWDEAMANAEFLFTAVGTPTA